MQEYALIFRTTPVVPSDQPTRNAAAREWAIALRDRGILRAANPLEDEGTVVTEHGLQPLSKSDAIASVLIVGAASLDEVVRLAQGHPGLVYGTQIEVRPVKVVPVR
jgi:hypothetical protein